MDDQGGGAVATAADFMSQSEPDLVMVIPIGSTGGGGSSGEAPGFLNEDQVLSNSRLNVVDEPPSRQNNVGGGGRVVRMSLPDDDEDPDERRSKINAGSSAEETSSLVSGGTAGGASNVAVSGSAVGSGAVGEKRTRFSLSHDEGSIGNTSDNLEAISEAASNHSLASR